ncbi:MAG TPA: nucleoside deaminase [Beijerinckiaceae bacterium]
MSMTDRFLVQAVKLARKNVRNGGRPFGAVVVRGDTVIAEGVNEVTSTRDPTAHAELLAIRAASRALATERLEDCRVYASGHPCPMCLSAMYLSGIAEAVYAYTNEDGAPYGLSTAAIYAELTKPLAAQALKIRHTPVRCDGTHPYEMWRAASLGSP